MGQKSLQTPLQFHLLSALKSANETPASNQKTPQSSN
jgi:hypothetical protein